ncbi:RHS repeat-associated core domain-containing protein [Ruficoccus sp. ZRK36]|uniref:RHS repeat-associated core domain-containing protein n=1 Tax=Ruficoccus sp. ZRK36 TaxID=2866311 RepID=UPI001C734815|nr:RHS repeat-associated core domain-containing protein [Ruficoccus sp. ZRK36]QYY36714.1 hypothetical protein K0V07_04380 [Ruficoccus sp. ZRK36]
MDTVTYDNAGRLKTRTGGRGIVTTYGYDPLYGYQTSISYGDGVTASVTYSEFDRAGRAGQVSDASGTRILGFDAGRVVSETYSASGEPWDGFVVNHDYDDASRLSSVSVSDGASSMHAVEYGYDANTGRLGTVSFAQGGETHTATYGYKEGTSQIDSVVQTQGSAEVLAVGKDYDNLGRLRSLSYGQPHQELGMTYAYNMANQRTYATRGNGEYWRYGYDALGQVVSATKSLPGGQIVPGYTFSYGFDDIGNRSAAGRDGNAARRQQYYAGTDATGVNGANALNQYGSRSVPRVLGVLGMANANATVTANAQAATRTGDYYQALLDYSSGEAPDAARYEDILLVGTYAGQGANGTDAVAEVETRAYLPPNPENFTYDDDGNLKSDSRWLYAWDGENRLVTLEPTATAISLGLPGQKLTFTYDSQGRRVKKEVYDWSDTTSTWETSPAATTAFLYDDWNLLAELDYDVSGVQVGSRTYAWGIDLSGSLQGAGGVGGLLAVNVSNGSSAGTYYPAYDGNGNVMAYVDAAGGEVAARFEYGPFGEPLRATGSAADALTYRFSTKYTDPETGLLYYGYRYYSPGMGRWLSRDPIEEEGGMNLYVFVGNNGVNGWDQLGMLTDEAVAAALLRHWAEPNGNDTFGRFGGYWGEYMKSLGAIRVEAQSAMQKEAQKAWDGNRSSGQYSSGTIHINLNRSFSLTATLNGIDYVIRGGYEIDRINCAITMRHNFHTITDVFDPHEADNPESSWADWVGRRLRSGGSVYPSGFKTYQDFNIIIVWNSDDIKFPVSNGKVLTDGGTKAWPFAAN